MATKQKKVAEPEPDTMATEKLDKSVAASFRRIAEVFRASPIWDNHTAAGTFETEADLLDPKGATKAEDPEASA